jgi:hypothetical protein
MVTSYKINELFLFQNILMEGQSLLPIDGRIWALEEMPYRGHLSKLYKDSFGSSEPPLVTVQVLTLAHFYSLKDLYATSLFLLILIL